MKNTKDFISGEYAQPDNRLLDTHVRNRLILKAGESHKKIQQTRQEEK
ncbi:MAG: hypothetical protein KGY69_07965 [Bacteroidales bacterium]|nr:hypothetical protein [Bacteroidales bacterium]